MRSSGGAADTGTSWRKSEKLYYEMNYMELRSLFFSNPKVRFVY